MTEKIAIYNEIGTASYSLCYEILHSLWSDSLS